MSSPRKKCVFEYEMSALKCDDADAGDVFALSHTTDNAALTIICLARDAERLFAFTVLSEFQRALLLSAALRASNLRKQSTAQIVYERLSTVACGQRNWMAIYVDAACVRVFGAGGFVCYYADSPTACSSVGGRPEGETYDLQLCLVDCQALSLVVSKAVVPHDSGEKVRCLIEASRIVKCTTDSLAFAFVDWIITNSSFCVVALSIRRVGDEHMPPPKMPGSPKKSELRVLDSHTDVMKRSRHCISVSTDSLDVDIL